MLRFATLYSGSSGNSTVVFSRNTTLLIDLGVSCRKIVTALNGFGLDPAKVDAVLITHEHSDHIGGCEVFLRHYHTPLFCTAQTADYLLERGCISSGQKRTILGEEPFLIGDIWVTPFVTSHDSLSCRGYRLECGDSAVAVATDIGHVPEEVFEALRGCGIVALESNYDEFMLRHGPYPRDLQERIASRRGHLSNDECAATVARLAAEGTSRVMLMHISEENNTPDTALIRCYGELENRGLEDCGIRIEAAPRYGSSGIWEV